MTTIELPNGQTVHQESVLGLAHVSAMEELRQEEFAAYVAKAKARIIERRASPWWKRWLPFYLTIRFHWNWSK